MSEILEFLRDTGIAHIDWRNGVMLAVGLAFIYLAISRDMEPYVLLPIGFGVILANLPLTGLMNSPATSRGVQEAGILGIVFHYTLSFWNILPPIMFLGLGALTDFGPIIANPKTLLLGAAAQAGIFVAFWGALATGRFSIAESAAIGIIGGADGPTTIYLSAWVAPDLLGITAVVAYSYIASVAFIQPPLMRLFTTRKERAIVMKPLRRVSKLERLVFPVIGTIIIVLLVPQSAPLMAMFFIGNLFRESGVVPRLTSASGDAILNITTLFLMLTIGALLSAERVFTVETVLIMGLGLVAFAFGTIAGLLFAKAMNLVLREKINPLIGSAGLSAFPMSARLAHQLGQEANPSNFLLPHAMGPNVAGSIGSAVAGGVFISVLV